MFKLPVCPYCGRQMGYKASIMLMDKKQTSCRKCGKLSKVRYKGRCAWLAAVFIAVLIAGILSLVCMLLFNPKHIKQQDDKYREAAGKPLDDALAGRK